MVMPLLAYLLGWLLLETNYERLGLLLLGSSPGGSQSNFWVCTKIAFLCWLTIVSFPDGHVQRRRESLLHDDFRLHLGQLCLHLPLGFPLGLPPHWQEHLHPLHRHRLLPCLLHLTLVFGNALQGWFISIQTFPT